MSSPTFAPSQQQSSASAADQPVVHFTIHQKNAPVHLAKRHLTIHPGQIVTIGRSSKSKDRSMLPMITNLLFDCPVISRSHAELKHNRFAPPDEQITITDRHSMHGTSVNDKKLEPYKPFALRSGDIIKLGEKVVRGSEIHDGVEVSFVREVLPTHRPISRGTSNIFQVPDPSDDESLISDLESVNSIKEKTSSSAKTTPEQTKNEPTTLGIHTCMPALGSQEKPIELDKPKCMSLRDIITLDDDADDSTRPHPPSAQGRKDVIQDTYAESGAENLAVYGMVRLCRLDDSPNEADGGDYESASVNRQHDYDDDQDLVDNLSESDASDLSNHYQSGYYRSADELEDEDDEMEQQHEQDDAEDDGPEELFTGARQPSPELGTDAVPAASNTFYPSIRAAASYPFQPAIPSQPWLAAPSSSYWGYPLPAYNACQLDPVSKRVQAMTEAGPSKSASASRLSIHNLVEASRDEQPKNQPFNATNSSPRLAGPADEDDDMLSTVANVGTVKRAGSVELASVAGTKRKADDIPIDAGSAGDELLRLYLASYGEKAPAISVPASAQDPVSVPTVQVVERPAKRSKVITQVGKYAASAAVGGVAMFAFLVSPWCEQLVEWGAA